MMKKAYFIMAAMLSSFTIALTGCSSDDAYNGATGAALDSPLVTIDATQTAANRLSFSWNGIPGATQYSYVLKNADGTLVDGGLTCGTSYSSKTLLPDNSYTLSVTAYPTVASAQKSSSAVTLAGKTDAVNITSSQTANSCALSWTNIIDADAVRYVASHQQSDIADTISTKSSSVDYAISRMGNYTLSLISYNAGDNEYTISNCYSEYSFNKVIGEIYLDGVGQTISNVPMTMNDDGTLTISKWYGGTTDITLKITSEGNIEVVNPMSVSQDGNQYYVLSGRSESAGDVYNVCVIKKRSFVYDGDGQKILHPLLAHGKIALYVSLTDYEGDDVENTSADCTYTFTW